MALSTKVGSFALNTSTGNQAVTGVGFQPTAVIFYLTKLTASGSAAGVTVGVGFGLSSSSRAAVGQGTKDSTGTVNSYDLAQSNVNVIYTTDGGGNLVVAADLVSMDSDGFTINIATAPASAYICNYIALGGTDITNTFIKEFQGKASTGTQAYTGVGFQADALMVISIGDTNTPPNHSALGSTPRFSVGYGTSSTAEANGTVFDDNGSQGLTSRKQAANIIEILTAGGVRDEAALSSIDSDGFTLNWTSVNNSTRHYWALCLKGGQYKIGTFNQATGTGAQATTGVGFQPTGLILQSANNAASSAVNSNARFSMGAGSSSSARAAIWFGDANAVSTLNNSQNLDTSNIIKMMTEGHGSPTTQAVADLTSLDSDGFTLNWSTADATAREIVYFAVGSSAITTAKGSFFPFFGP